MKMKIHIGLKKKLVVYASEIGWNGTPAVLLRGKEYDLKFFDELTLLPNQFYFESKPAVSSISCRKTVSSRSVSSIILSA